jgi:hypothetical protein
METTAQIETNPNGKMSRRERKMQERWTITTKNDNEQSSTKTFLGVEFPPIAVLRRKFSSSPPPTSPSTTTLNPLAIKKKDSSSIKAKALGINNPSEDNIDKPNNHISSPTSNPAILFSNQVSLL